MKLGPVRSAPAHGREVFQAIRSKAIDARRIRHSRPKPRVVSPPEDHSPGPTTRYWSLPGARVADLATEVFERQSAKCAVILKRSRPAWSLVDPCRQRVGRHVWYQTPANCS
jgi:hypothetical protein